LIFWLACMFGSSNTFAYDRPINSDARLGVVVLSCKPLHFALSKAFCRTLRGAHAFAFSVYVIDASYCGTVLFWEYRVV